MAIPIQLTAVSPTPQIIHGRMGRRNATAILRAMTAPSSNALARNTHANGLVMGDSDFLSPLISSSPGLPVATGIAWYGIARESDVGVNLVAPHRPVAP